MFTNICFFLYSVFILSSTVSTESIIANPDIQVTITVVLNFTTLITYSYPVDITWRIGNTMLL